MNAKQRRQWMRKIKRLPTRIKVMDEAKLHYVRVCPTCHHTFVYWHYKRCRPCMENTNPILRMFHHSTSGF